MLKSYKRSETKECYREQAVASCWAGDGQSLVSSMAWTRGDVLAERSPRAWKVRVEKEGGRAKRSAILIAWR